MIRQRFFPNASLKRRTALLAVVLVLGCTINKHDDSASEIFLNTDSTGTATIITVSRGPAWTHQISPGPFRINIYPQLAIWMESDDPERFQTLYVSGATGDFGNHATKQDLQAEYFAISLPAWSSKVLANGQALPSTETPYTDGITSATPKSSFTLYLHISDLPDTCRLYAEIGKSMDHNTQFSETETDWVGQPAVIYAVDLYKPLTTGPYALEPLGYTERNGSGETQRVSDLKGLDTGLNLIDAITVDFE
jgi:hypothetical protein